MDITPKSPKRPLQSHWLLLAGIFLLAFAVRAGFAWHRTVSRAETAAQLEFPDEREYFDLAVSLSNDHSLALPDGHRAKRMPLYPALLTPCLSLSRPVLAARLLQAAIAAAGALAIAALGTRLAGPKAGLLAGLLVAADPFSIFFSSLLLTEVPFSAALSAFLLAAWPLVDPAGRLTPARTAAAIAAAAACVYLRPEALGFVLLWAVVVWCIGARNSLARLQIAMILAGMILALMPWTLRNRMVLGRWVVLTTNLGASLYDAQGPRADGSSDLSHTDTLPGLSQMNELQRNDYLRSQAWQTMRDDPGRVIRLGGTKFLRTWNLRPNFAGYRSGFLCVLSMVWMVPVLVLGGFGLCWLGFQGGWRGAVVLLLPAVYWTGLFCLFVGSVRYRQPAMPFIEVLAAIGLGHVCGWWVRRRQGAEAAGEIRP